ncbi:outer membrane beta-barrel protein [Bacteroidota bacterium]
MKKHRLIFIPLLLLVGIIAAQEEECAVKLDQAQRLYEQGIIEIEDMLKDCFEEGFTKEEKQRAYKLLISSNIFDDNLIKADSLMYQFLSDYPEYQLVTTDPEDFVYLFNSYRTEPIVTLGITAGINRADIRVIEPYGVHDQNTSSGEYKGQAISYTFGIKAIRKLIPKLELHLDLLYQQNVYQYDLENFQIDDPSKKREDIHLDKYSVTKLSFPLTLTYDYEFRGLLPYARAGIGMSMMQSSSTTPSRFAASDVDFTDIEGSALDITSHFKKLHVDAIIGGGIKFPIPKGNIFMDLRYNIGLNNIIKVKNNTELQSRYGYEFDDYALNNFAVTVGWVYSIYRPKKRE